MSDSSNRLRLTYPLDDAGTVREIEFPLVVGVLGNFTGNAERELPALFEREFEEVTRSSLDDLMQTLGPRLSLEVSDVAGRNRRKWSSQPSSNGVGNRGMIMSPS